ncbi:5330_t:CDS:1, partial [Racocetra fulgida]
MAKIKKACISNGKKQRCLAGCTITKICRQCEQSNPRNTVNNSFSLPDDNHIKINRIHRREKNSKYAARQDELNVEFAALEKELDYFKRMVDSLEQNHSHLSLEISSLKKENSIL